MTGARKLRRDSVFPRPLAAVVAGGMDILHIDAFSCSHYPLVNHPYAHGENASAPDPHCDSHPSPLFCPCRASYSRSPDMEIPVV